MAGIVVMGIALSLSACTSSAGTSPSTGAPRTTVAPSTSASTSTPNASPAGGPPTVPTSGAYLGAWVHPASNGNSTGGGSAFSVEQQSVPAVTAVTGRPLAILHLYTAWARPAPVPELDAIASAGSIPLLDWGCASDGAAVATGTDDQLITRYAEALKAYGKPVLLRWCWEMNLAASHPNEGGPSGFVSAWVHIWTIFHTVGVTNVSFVWCPALTGTDPTPYYPGDQYVDWIGFDGYDRSGTDTFSGLFGGVYQQWAGHAKPMMVAETGSRAASQAAFIESIGADAPNLPAFKAIIYFDAAGPAADWQLSGPGLDAFGTLAKTPYFNPR